MSNDLKHVARAEKSAVHTLIDEAYDSAEKLVFSIGSVFRRGTCSDPRSFCVGVYPWRNRDSWVKIRLEVAADLEERVAAIENDLSQYQSRFAAISVQLQYSAPQLEPTTFHHSVNGRFADSCLKALAVEMKRWGMMTTRVWSGWWIDHDDWGGLITAWEEDGKVCPFSVELGNQILDRLYIERGQLYRDHIPAQAILNPAVATPLWPESITCQRSEEDRELVDEASDRLDEVAEWIEGGRVARVATKTESDDSTIPPDKRTRPMAKSEVARILDRRGNKKRLAEWTTDCIKLGVLRYERINRQSGFYHIDDFPGHEDKVSPK